MNFAVSAPAPPPQPAEQGKKGKKRKKIKDPNKPVKPPNTFIMYVQDNGKSYMTENGCTYKEARTLLGKQWETLGADDKKVYTDRYAVAQAKWKVDMESYVPPEGEVAYAAAAAAAAAAVEQSEPSNKNKKKRKKHKKDPGAPTRPKTAYLLYGDVHRPRLKEQFPDYKQSEIMTELGKMWKTVDQITKSGLEQDALGLKAEYDVAVATYKASDEAKAWIAKQDAEIAAQEHAAQETAKAAAAVPPSAPGAPAPPAVELASAAAVAVAAVAMVAAAVPMDAEAAAAAAAGPVSAAAAAATAAVSALEVERVKLLATLVEANGGPEIYADNKAKQQELLAQFNKDNSTDADKDIAWVQTHLARFNDQASGMTA